MRRPSSSGTQVSSRLDVVKNCLRTKPSCPKGGRAWKWSRRADAGAARRENQEVRLAGKEGNQLEMAILGYQFPNELTDPWDSNWLLVSVKVVTPAGSWEVVDPCLTTWETKRLVSWLVGAVGRTDAPAATFVEPNLTVSAAPVAGSPEGVLLTFGLALELRPPWGQGTGSAGDFRVILDIDRPSVARAAASLLGDLVRFPQRGSEPV